MKFCGYRKNNSRSAASARARVFEKNESDSSPELNDSFKAFLNQQKKKKKPENLVLPADDVIMKIKLEPEDVEEKLEADGGDLLTPVGVIKSNFTEGLRSTELNNSTPSLNGMRPPSVNVTKTRPIYNASPVEVVNSHSSTSFDSTLDKIEDILSAEQTPQKETTIGHEFVLKSQEFLSSTRIFSPLGEEKNYSNFKNLINFNNSQTFQKRQKCCQHATSTHLLELWQVHKNIQHVCHLQRRDLNMF